MDCLVEWVGCAVVFFAGARTRLRMATCMYGPIWSRCALSEHIHQLTSLAASLDNRPTVHSRHMLLSKLQTLSHEVPV